jgi:hypothetical protein
MYSELVQQIQRALADVPPEHWDDPPRGVLPADGFDVRSRSVSLKDFMRRNLYQVAIKGPFRKKVLKSDPGRLSERQRQFREAAQVESLKRKNFVLSPDDTVSVSSISRLLDIMCSQHDVIVPEGGPHVNDMFRVLQSTAAGSVSSQIISICKGHHWGYHLFILQSIMKEVTRSINRLQKIR